MKHSAKTPRPVRRAVDEESLGDAFAREKEELERKLANNKGAGGTDEELVSEVQRLQAERDLIRAKVEKVMAAIAAIDPEIVEAAR